ncbi:3'-5' exonuclease [Sulfitobacter aestuariivivens]
MDFLRPFDLIERILNRHNGRTNLLARLGPEAEDGLNAMLAQALAYERTEVPSLTGFLQWMQTDELEIKRQIDNSSDQIRVMSVHGAKGLEAPIVILPDTVARTISIKDELIDVGNSPIWKSPSADMPDRMRKRVDELRSAQRRERMRLLYVAMTRAEKWLIVAAAGKLANDNSDWYSMIANAMGHINANAIGQSDILRYEEGDWDRPPQAGSIQEPAEKTF